MNKPIFKHFEKGDRPSAKEYNRLVDLVAGIANSLHIQGFFDSTGFHTRRTPAGVGVGIIHKIFEVQNATANKDGIYDCYEQTLDATEWADTAGDPKFDDKDAIVIEVLNLAEFDPPGTYIAHLVVGDLLAAWKMKDDEGNTRWIGIPISSAHTCSVKIQVGGVPSNATGPFTCKLLNQDGNETGAAIDVWPRTHLGTNDFDGDVWPTLAQGDDLAVYKDWDGKWYFSGCVFDDTTTCA